MRKNAFTLIELLVVIAIIAILAAILFPVFAQAKAAAKKTSSLSNIKEIDLGNIMYTNDFDDTFSMGSGPNWWNTSCGGESWVYTVQPYIKNSQIFLSPGDSKPKGTWPTWMPGQAAAVNISYAANGYLLELTAGGGTFRGVIGMAQGKDLNGGAPCDQTLPYNGWIDKSVQNGSAITQPAGTIMLAERYGSYPLFGPSSFFTGNKDWDFVGTGQLVPDGASAANPLYQNQMLPRPLNTKYLVNGVAFSNDVRAQGGVNSNWSGKSCFSWVDGHASSTTPLATNPDSVAHPESNQWDALR